MTQQDDQPGNQPKRPFASSPCYAHELSELTENTTPTSPQQVSRWRKRERQRLLSARARISDSLEQLTTAIVADLAPQIESLRDGRPELIVSLYWPMPGELDFRHWMAILVAQQVRVVLPVVIDNAGAMIFREWTAGASMIPGVWDIPYPAEGEVLVPDVVIAPLVGFDAHCYRLGHGGGYFDRTLASLPRRTCAIGVGPPLCEISTIYPQPHDIPMDMIVTGSGSVRHRVAGR